MAGKKLLSDTPTNLIRKCKIAFNKQGIPVREIILFGSYAKGNPHPESDLDIAVVSDTFGKNSYDEMVLLYKIAADIDPMIEPHPYHPDEINDPYSPLASEIKKHGKIII